MPKLKLRQVVFALTLGLLSAPVQAASITYQLQPFGIGGVVAGDTLDPTVGSQYTSPNDVLMGLGAVRARHGFIGAYAEAQGQFDVLTSITFRDELTVVSELLAFGTPVDVDLRMGFSWVPPSAGGAADASIEGAFSLSTIGVPGSEVTTRLFVSAADGITIEETTGTLHTTVGAMLALTAIVNATASAGNCCQSGHAVADAFNTLHFYADPVGDTFSYLSETGEGYLSPPTAVVPEPSTLTLGLLSLGLAKLAAHRRRKGSPR